MGKTSRISSRFSGIPGEPQRGLVSAFSGP